ncbi:MAG: (Fe-S)-binding protein [bacterium]|nr:(Fe-S)-binding protein [bacterium]
MEGHVQVNETELQTVIDQVKAIKNGPRVLQLYMDICAHCGVCAEQCHVARTMPESRTNPAARSDHIRQLYKRYGSTWGQVLKAIGAARDITEDEVAVWQRDFYECSGCRRCAKFCPFGIDNSILTRKGRAVVHALGKSPFMMSETQRISDETGNDEGQTYAAFVEACRFLCEEVKDDWDIDVEIPIDRKGADILFIPASADLVSFPETHMGVAVFFKALEIHDGTTWTMASTAFDGANFGLFTGDDPHMARKNQAAYDACIDLGVKKLVIGECGHAYRIAKRMGPTASHFGNPFETTNIFLLADEYLQKGVLKFDKRKVDEIITYHDPCNFARSTNVFEEPRRLLSAMTDNFVEMTPNRTENWCCGGGGGLAVMDGAEKVEMIDGTFLDYRMKVGKMKVDQIMATGANYCAAPCANCKRQLMQLMEHYETGVKIGGVFDILGNAIVLEETKVKAGAKVAS